MNEAITAKQLVAQFHNNIGVEPKSALETFAECTLGPTYAEAFAPLPNRHMTLLVKMIEDGGRNVIGDIPNVTIWQGSNPYINKDWKEINLEPQCVQYRVDTMMYSNHEQDRYIADMLLCQVHDRIQSYAANYDDVYVTPLHVRQYDDNVIRVGWRIGGV